MAAEWEIGGYKIKWLQAPSGSSGKARAEVAGGTKNPPRIVEFDFERDATGVWIRLDDRKVGFDLVREIDDSGAAMYQLSSRTSGTIHAGVLKRAGAGAAASGGAQKNRPVRVRAQMPGRLILVSVQTGQAVKKGDRLGVMEAMKMENEIKAPANGVVSKVSAAAGSSVETGADLFLIETN